MENPEKHARSRVYSCEGLPSHRLGDLDLLQLNRERFGDEIIDEQIALLGTDRVIESMQRAHQAHLIASELSPRELHQRAEVMESLMLEFGVPALGASSDTPTDLHRVQMFVRVVKGLADELVQYQMREEAMEYPSVKDAVDEDAIG